MQNMISILIIAGIILVALIAILMFFTKLYKRASKEISFVRTGFGGQKVVMNGGALVLPVYHESIPVNMNTLRLEVKRNNEHALITRDRMRVNVAAEFYVRVKPTEDAIASAAQTLGLKTMHPEELKDLVEGKFVDALRSVAAEMAMEELHEKRVDFVQKVQQVVTEDLLKNGLELETVSLTGLDQTSKSHFNPDNAFDADGLTKLTEKIEERRKKRNDIVQDTEVAIADKNLEAERKKLEIIKEEEHAKLKQEREIEIRRASQMAEIAKEQAKNKQEAEQAQIESKKDVDMFSILAEKSVEEERIDKDKLLKEKDILKERAIASFEIEKKKALELAEQDRAIAIAEKSKAQSEAEAEADMAKAIAVKEEEAVKTVRDTEIAERVKTVELVKARENAEKEAIKIKIAAETEKKSAMDKAEAIRTIANADADKQRVKAQGESDAEKLKAEAAQKRYAVDAEGQRAINESGNILSDQQIAMQIRMALIKHLPDIIKESVKPMENIDGIKIIHVDGLTGGNNATMDGEQAAQNVNNLSDQLVNSALRYRGQAPLIDSLMSEIGIKAGDINGFTSGIKDGGANSEMDI